VLALLCGAFMVLLDGTIVLVARRRADKAAG
jgi:hypothetical protein